MTTDSTSVTAAAAVVQPPEPRPEDRVAWDLWWRSCADQALTVLADSGQVFTTDDLRGDLFGLVEPRSPNHWGALVSAASKAGLIEPCGFAISISPSRRKGVTREWRGVRPTPVAE